MLKETYSTASALLVMECTKLAVSLIQIIRSDAESDVPAGTACSKYVSIVITALWWPQSGPSLHCKQRMPLLIGRIKNIGRSEECI